MNNLEINVLGKRYLGIEILFPKLFSNMLLLGRFRIEWRAGAHLSRHAWGTVGQWPNAS